MKTLKRILIGLAILVVVGIVGVVIFASTIDLNSYKATIASEIEAATGRKVTINGDIDKSILSFSPTVVVNDVSLANASWGSKPNMITAKRIELAVDLWPLISGTIKVRRFALIGADIFLETDGKGLGNWNLGAGGGTGAGTGKKTASAPPSGGGGGLPGIAEVTIRGTTVTFRDGRTKLTSVIRIDEIEARAAGEASVIELKTKATYQDVPLTTEGRLGSVAALKSGGAGYPIDLKVRFGSSDLAVKLSADLSGGRPVLTGTIDGKELDIDKVTSTIGGGKSGAGSGGGGRLFSAEPLSVGFLHAADAKVAITLGKLKAGGKVFTDVAAKIDLKGGNLLVDPIALKTSGGTIKGTVGIDARSDKPKIALVLNGSGVSLSDVSGQSTVGSRLNLSVTLRGAGASMREIAATVRGPVIAIAGPGPINSSGLSFISTNLLQVIPVLGSSKRLALTCIVARFDFVNGIGNSRVLVIDTTRMTIAGKGTISLRSETLDLILVPTTKGKSLASVAALVPIRVRGPLSNPQARPDPTGVPKEVVGAIFGTLEMPVEILGNILGRKSSKSTSPCATARAQATGAAPARRRGGAREPGLIKRLNPFKK